MELTETELLRLVDKGAKLRSLSEPEKPSEVDEILREMKKFNSAVVSILSQPDVPTITPTYVPPSPIVNVAAPSVSVTPSIRIEQPARRWRFTVTQRDNTAQMRIKEIIVESLE